MRISNVSYVLCRSELAKPIPLSCGSLTHRNFGLIRIDTDDGLVGWGETSINFPPWTYRERAATIEEGLAPLIVGENALDTLRLRDKMVAATRSFTRMWAKGAISQAISGVEMALWDLLGKALDQPVATLLGGINRAEFDCYATGLRADDPVAGAREALDAGYRSIKIRVGFNDEKDVAMAHAVRNEVGDDADLLIDANQAFDLPRARRMISELRTLSPYWIEEPVLSDDFDAQAKLRTEFPDVPLAWGENSYDAHEFRHVAENELAQFIMPDPCRTGGMAAALEAARCAHANGIPVSAHHYGSDVGFAAMLHLMAAAPKTDLVLRDVAAAPLREDIVVEDLRPVSGKVTLPEGPGLGVTPNVDVIADTRLVI